MAVVSMHSLLEAGAHFGHQARKWHPNMKPYIFAERNGIHIINLQQTIVGIRNAFQAVRQTVLERKQVLFVATKKQAQKVIEEESTKCGMPYVNHRWLGGILTNFVTLQKSTNKLRQYEKMEVDGTFDSLSRKEFSRINKKKNFLQKTLGGIKEMNGLPGMLFIIDPVREAIAVAEARKKNIPIVAVTDTDCDPSLIQYPIPGNDDAIRSISLFSQIISQAVIDADNEIGLEVIETLQTEEQTPEEPTAQVADEAPELVKKKDEEEVISSNGGTTA